MKVNGQLVELKQEQTLLEFLADAQYDTRTIAVERNGMIVPKDEFENICLKDEDTLEIVRFVGGG